MSVLSEIEKFAFLRFAIKDIAIIIGDPDIKMLIEEEGTEYHKAYKKGILLNDAEFRQSVWETAKAGSSPAQTLWHKIIHNSSIDNLE
jgi:hypothetical protein